MHYYLGIDPGRNGALALIDEHKNVIYCELMPLIKGGYNYPLVRELIDKLPTDTTVLLELKPGVMDKSASPTTSFGFHCGVLYGLCLHKNMIIISPKTWKAEFDVNRAYKEAREDMKHRTIHTAEKTFSISLKMNQDGLAEALLLAEYGRRQKL